MPLDPSRPRPGEGGGAALRISIGSQEKLQTGFETAKETAEGVFDRAKDAAHAAAEKAQEAAETAKVRAAGLWE